MDNVHYFSLLYLNDWVYWDERFIERLCNQDKSIRIEGLHDAAKYYKVTRNFKYIDECTRFESALDEVEKILKPNSEIEAIDAVNQLAKSLMAIYGKNAISAASKFLWLKYKSPIIIYDSRAYNWLKSKNYRIVIGDYSSYYAAWLNAFSLAEPDIKEALLDLYKVKKYSQAAEYDDLAIIKLTSNRWFRERVFDKFLWFNAGNG